MSLYKITLPPRTQIWVDCHQGKPWGYYFEDGEWNLIQPEDRGRFENSDTQPLTPSDYPPFYTPVHAYRFFHGEFLAEWDHILLACADEGHHLTNRWLQLAKGNTHQWHVLPNTREWLQEHGPHLLHLLPGNPLEQEFFLR